VSPPEHPTHLIPLSVCLSCVLSASPITAQLAPVRFCNNQEQQKMLAAKREQEKKACSFWGPCVLEEGGIRDNAQVPGLGNSVG
jgi:hypothetical protein